MIQLGGKLYNIPIEVGVPVKLVRLIKMCSNDTYSKVRIGKRLPDTFPIQNGLQQGGALWSLLLIMMLGRFWKTRWA
jgi:hypothetical protein